MRRLIAFAGSAAMVGTVLATPAAAAPADPLQALAAKLESAHGVHYETVQRTDDATFKIYGDLQFGWSRVKANRAIVERVLGPSATQEERHENISETIWVGDDVFHDDDKGGWKLNDDVTAAGLDDPAVHALSVAEIGALLKSAKKKSAGDVLDGVSTTVYEGRKRGKTRVTDWKVWIGSDGLIRRVTSDTANKNGKDRTVRDTYLTEWGKQVWIYAPDQRFVTSTA
ncbi:hypothetical protein FDA94_22390 [Herbidospora galbida]|uniref:Uncharacterized protein n=1 Tax=Herbidospora galbida TaxID=2575442 RepID=A0A4U3MC85_9ACTN|nr:hypothetical protein [Herbidospora galbida]TKK86270.1 hypothetical protein FDA94_22390 [Herbidospora galbida]